MINKKKKVLCVDDEVMNLQLLEAILKPAGYETILSTSGIDALNIIQKERIDIVLLDVMMPEIDGYEVCKTLKNSVNRYIPVIMITSLTQKDERIKGIEAGAEEFLTKPFNFAEVLARVKMLLKMKDLNDRLDSAYNNIVNMTHYGESSIQIFNPLVFDLQSSIDNMAARAIRQQHEKDERPEIFLVGIFSETEYKWTWTLYRFMENKTKKEYVGNAFEHLIIIPEKGQSSTTYLNPDDFEKSGIYHFLSEIKKYNPVIDNMVSYTNSVLCVFAFNYGYEVSAYDASVLNNFVVQSLFFKQLSSQIKETENAFDYLVYALARASEANDEDTGNHILRVGSYCAVISEYLGLGDKFTRAIKLQATLHDVGKIHTPASILKKPDTLTPEEWKEMQKHTIYGAKIIGDHFRLTIATNITITHHERWDGSGYPYGLKGEQIPLEGRIISIADIYDALRNQRVYKPAFDSDTTNRIITEGDGRVMPYHFDPQVLDAFKHSTSMFEQIYEELK
ncbi:MAG: response regulator [Nitrospirae bacterium]|nr:response regulator [Nitrospirota bacterium]